MSTLQIESITVHDAGGQPYKLDCCLDVEGIKRLCKDNAALRAALAPFAHPDLSRQFAGNCEGDASPVFQRNKAMLTLGHFRQALAALAGNKPSQDGEGPSA